LGTYGLTQRQISLYSGERPQPLSIRSDPENNKKNWSSEMKINTKKTIIEAPKQKKKKEHKKVIKKRKEMHWERDVSFRPEHVQASACQSSLPDVHLCLPSLWQFLATVPVDFHFDLHGFDPRSSVVIFYLKRCGYIFYQRTCRRCWQRRIVSVL